ncbi:MAG: hypothetical protein A3F84_19050 [Candidatus Handelsmanbacteria bacterium RIFCSPLOWO2_12_FULL_64_10]|uniref:Doubled CXXCH motif domain-containing protein n=1 Tax=Handelsmanbacteria sp. (strain RIFCSPLOWO2_12_FULL_64_10) TaxID=1817868 RepID=A0A1F6CPG1_HANXR|nr:MAG: hypothetical protein A3F84_19050 [Candidatus Handelsmanbacteria bacterium RIFCSPLOWO2_12_FULL_64_10]
MTTHGPDGKPGAYEIVHTLGARQQQTYLVRMPGGRLQVLPTIYDITRGRWFDTAEGVIRIDRPLRPDDYYYWSNPGRTWNSQCAECHATGLHNRYDPATDAYDTQVAAFTITCEACHGPAARHVAARAKGDTTDPAGKLIPLRRLSPSKSIELCAACHAKKHVMKAGFEPGGDFFAHFDPVLLDDDLNFWPDGRDKLLVFAYHPFSEGRPHREGGLVCADCHDPHGSGRVADLRLPPEDPGLCAGCHAEIADRPEPHTHHPAGSAGSHCVRCHMPPGENETLTVTDHRMTVPAPQNTVRFGTPNACNQAGCHADRTPDWASRQAERWYGAYQAPYVQKSEAIARGRAGDPWAAGPLTRILTDLREGPFLRAAAASLLGRIRAGRRSGESSGEEAARPDALTPHASTPPTIHRIVPPHSLTPLDALVAALRDPHPSIRARAATALGQANALRALRPLLDALRDPAVAVRIRAAFSLTALGYVPSPSDTAAHQSFAEHEAWVGGIMADNPTARVTLGKAYEGRKDFQSALREYRAALRLNPHEAEAEARAEAVGGEIEKHRRATAMLSAGPAGGRTHAALGVIAERWGDYGRAAEHLTEAIRRGMGTEAVLVSLGDACRGLGRREEAVRAYRQALALNPLAPGAIRGLALIAYAEGREEEGRGYEERYRKAVGSGTSPTPRPPPSPAGEGGGDKRRSP